MSSPSLTTIQSSTAEIVDLAALRAEHLDGLWEREKRLWREELYWDAAPGIAVIRTAMKRRSLAGKAIRVQGVVVGCGYYLVDGSRAVVGSFMLAPEARAPGLGFPLAECLLASIQAEPEVSRIESQFIPFGLAWLRDAFQTRGFREYPRVFLRRCLDQGGAASAGSDTFEFEPWSRSYLSRAALLMQQAHTGMVDAEVNELYRRPEGCRTLLENIIHQQGCGNPIPIASYVVRKPPEKMLAGFIVSTEIAAGHAHLAQVAVSPSAQGLGLGKLLLGRAIDALSRAGYRTVSLMVTESNQRAISLYASMGFQTVLRFPVFSWDRKDLRRTTPS
jgi:ribosomal protein S18 acetylase RimI-like enzyme